MKYYLKVDEENKQECNHTSLTYIAGEIDHEYLQVTMHKFVYEKTKTEVYAFTIEQFPFLTEDTIKEGVSITRERFMSAYRISLVSISDTINETNEPENEKKVS